MTAYVDVLQANRLIEEQARLAVGIAMIDEGGTVSSFTIAPKPADPVVTPRAPPSVQATTPIAVMTIDPPPELMAEARAAMVKRHNEILAELGTFGVTGAPPMSL